MPRPRKPRPPEPTDDEIRERLLRSLYDTYKNARSADAAAMTMGEIKRAMKPLGVKERRIVSNLTYLAQSRWVEEIVDRYPIIRGGRPVSVKSVKYRIGSAGVDRIEGPSSFQRVERMAGINITNIRGVTVIGHDNVVDTRFEQLFRSLDLLGAEIRATEGLSDRDKLSYQAEIETIKSQLMKPDPDRGILHRAWDALKAFATVGSAAAAVDRVRSLIDPILR